MQIEARALLLQEFAHLLINAQHLANTPLQTIENAVAILQTRHPDRRRADRFDEPGPRCACMSSCGCFRPATAYINWQNVVLPSSVEEFERRMRDLIEQEKE